MIDELLLKQVLIDIATRQQTHIESIGYLINELDALKEALCIADQRVIDRIEQAQNMCETINGPTDRKSVV